MGFSSTGSLENRSNNFMSTTSFTDLLNSSGGVDDSSASSRLSGGTRSLADHIADRTGSGIPKFKSLPPPSLPLSPPPFSPSSYFAIPAGLSPAELLDSPVLLSSSNLLPSPTTGAFGANWKPNYNNDNSIAKQEDGNKYSDFTFQTQARPNHVTSTNNMFHSSMSSFTNDQALRGGHDQNQQSQQSSWNFRDQNNQNDPSSIKAVVKCEFPASQAQNYNESNVSDQNSSFQPAQYIREQRKSEDGYNWRKYGQKQVKGSENPRSYYKCTYPNCPMKKKIEKSLDGQITEIVYKGSHNHPKPVNSRRSSSSAASTFQTSMAPSNDLQDHSYIQQRSLSGQMESVATPETSSISLVDDEVDMGSQRSRSAGNDCDDEAPEAKRWKGEVENECMSAAPGSRTVREPRVVVQTTSDIDILDDGYRWRKYGQKVVKGNPNPRSYYKCTHPGCPVRKHVERAAHDLRAVITTYEGKHNHDVPAARGSGMNRNLSSSGNNGAVQSMAIRPSAVNYVSSGDPNPLRINQRLPASSEDAGQLSSYTVEMLQNPSNFGFSGFINQAQYTDSIFANNRAKEEPKDDMFFESMLC